MVPRFVSMRLAAAGLLISTTLAAQTAAPARPSLRAGALPAGLALDGRLDETAWREADSIPALTELEPREGGVPAGRTVVRVLADADALVFGINARYADPAGLVSFARQRDASFSSEDHVRLVLDTFLDGRSGYVFAVNPDGARYDALVSGGGEDENADWDGVWEAATARTSSGWSAEIRIPVKTLIFGRGLDAWGFNVQRRVQALQETDRWASPARDYEVTQTSRAGLLTGLPTFSLGLGLGVRPSLTAGAGEAGPGARLRSRAEPSLDATQRLGTNLLASLTVNTDFAETEVDTRRTNLTRFPLFFPEKRTFFLEGADVFEFGLGMGTDVIPFFSRRIGLFEGREVPLRAGVKLNGREGGTSLGALAVRTGAVRGLLPDSTRGTLVPDATMGVVRVRQNLLRESSAGVIATFGDPQGRAGSWLAGGDFTYQTSRFRGDKNFLVGIWGLAMGREGLAGDRTAAGIKVDYPNDLWDVALTFKRVGDGFQPSLGFVPRPGVNIASFSLEYSPRPDWGWVRQMFYELETLYVTDLSGRWQSYEVFTAPVNWRLESGDRFEANWVPVGERLDEPFEVADGVVVPAGTYRWTRYRLEAGTAAKRRLSGQATWWFGGFYGGRLHQLELEAAWHPSPLVTVELEGERNIGRLPGGRFTADLVGTRLRLNVSPDLQVNGFVQYDSESRSLGANTRLRWSFSPLGDLFVVYNHNLRDVEEPDTGIRRWERQSAQLLLKVAYTLRY
ncbi:MAG TPA: DUF5916 domain-containing protein [Longimicrobium sp.]